MSAPFCWPCSISIRLSPSLHCWCLPFSVGHAAFLFISQVCHCWCPPLSVGHAAFLFMCLPGLSLVVSALCRWPCSISILLSPRSVTVVSLSVGHEAFPFTCLPGPCHCWCRVAFHFYSFVFQVCHWWCPPLSVGHEAFLFICFPGPLLLLSALFRWPCSISIHLSPLVSALFVGHAAFLFISLPGL